MGRGWRKWRAQGCDAQGGVQAVHRHSPEHAVRPGEETWGTDSLHNLRCAAQTPAAPSSHLDLTGPTHLTFKGVVIFLSDCFSAVTPERLKVVIESIGVAVDKTVDKTVKKGAKDAIRQTMVAAIKVRLMHLTVLESGGIGTP